MMRIDVRNEREFVWKLLELMAEHALTQDDPDIPKGSNEFVKVPEIRLNLTGLHILVRENTVLFSYLEEGEKLQMPITLVRYSSPLEIEPFVMPIAGCKLGDVWEKHPPVGLVLSKELEECLK